MSGSPDRNPREIPPDWETPPPIGGSWKRIYLAVVVYTCLLIAALYWMSVSFNR